jgi:hypothetical protein
MDEKSDISGTITVPFISDEPTGASTHAEQKYQELLEAYREKYRLAILFRMFFSSHYGKDLNVLRNESTVFLKRRILSYDQSTAGLSGFDFFKHEENVVVGHCTCTGENLLDELHISKIEKLEASLAEARTNREIVSALMDNDGLGLHVLVQLRAALRMSATELATATEADLNSMAGVLAQLVRLGIVDLHDRVFYYTASSATYLRRIEETTGVTLGL